MAHERLLQKNSKDVVQFLVEKKMRKNHTKGDELAILRKTVHALVHGLPIPTEFEEYYNEAESAKAEAKARLN